MVSGGSAYFGTYTKVGLVVKVDLAAMTRTGSVALTDGIGNLASGLAHGGSVFFGTDSQATELSSTNAYFGPSSAATVVVKVSSGLVQQATLTLDVGFWSILAAVQDGGMGYWGIGAGSGSGKVVAVDLPSFTKLDSLALGAGTPTSAVIVSNSEYSADFPFLFYGTTVGSVDMASGHIAPL